MSVSQSGSSAAVILDEIIRQPTEEAFKRLQEHLGTPAGYSDFLDLLKSNNMLAFVYLKQKASEISENSAYTSSHFLQHVAEAADPRCKDFLAEYLDVLSTRGLIGRDFVLSITQRRDAQLLAAITRKYTRLERSDALYTEISDRIEMLTPLLTSLWDPSNFHSFSNSRDLQYLLETLYNLLSQDIHPLFEDNAPALFAAFAFFYGNPCADTWIVSLYELFVTRYPEVTDFSQIISSLCRSRSLEPRVVSVLTRACEQYPSFSAEVVPFLERTLRFAVDDDEAEDFTRAVLAGADPQRGCASRLIVALDRVHGNIPVLFSGSQRLFAAAVLRRRDVQLVACSAALVSDRAAFSLFGYGSKLARGSSSFSSACGLLYDSMVARAQSLLSALGSSSPEAVIDTALVRGMLDGIQDGSSFVETVFSALHYLIVVESYVAFDEAVLQTPARFIAMKYLSMRLASKEAFHASRLGLVDSSRVAAEDLGWVNESVAQALVQAEDAFSAELLVRLLRARTDLVSSSAIFDSLSKRLEKAECIATRPLLFLLEAYSTIAVSNLCDDRQKSISSVVKASPDISIVLKVIREEIVEAYGHVFAYAAVLVAEGVLGSDFVFGLLSKEALWSESSWQPALALIAAAAFRRSIISSSQIQALYDALSSSFARCILVAVAKVRGMLLSGASSSSDPVELLITQEKDVEALLDSAITHVIKKPFVRLVLKRMQELGVPHDILVRVAMKNARGIEYEPLPHGPTVYFDV